MKTIYLYQEKIGLDSNRIRPVLAAATDNLELNNWKTRPNRSILKLLRLSFCPTLAYCIIYIAI